MTRPLLTVSPIPERFPGSATRAAVHDFRFDRSSCCWVPWLDADVPPPTIPAGMSFSDIIVPTKDTIRCKDPTKCTAGKRASLNVCTG